jgi:hypothetical protein
VGAEDAAGLTRPVAFVTVAERREGIEDELQRFVVDRLEPYKHPRALEVVDDLPRTHLGKVNRTVMQDRARDLLAHGCSLDLHQRSFGPGRCASISSARCFATNARRKAVIVSFISLMSKPLDSMVPTSMPKSFSLPPRCGANSA